MPATTAKATWSSAVAELEWHAGRTPPESRGTPPRAAAGRAQPTSEPVATRSHLHRQDGDGGAGVGAASPARSGHRHPRVPRAR